MKREEIVNNIGRNSVSINSVTRATTKEGEFVTYETAKKLREKGFREMCTHCYRNGNFTPQEMFCGLRRNTHPEWSFNSMKMKLKDTHKQVQLNIIDAPTISQVLKWLRDEKAIHIDIAIWEGGWYCDVWVYEFYEEEKEYLIQIRYQSDDYESYEDAALAGIEYVIDNLI